MAFTNYKRLKIASLLLASIAIMPIFSALLMMFSSSSEFYYPDLVEVDINTLNMKLKKSIDLAVQVRGLYLLVSALFWLIVALIPLCNGEKWAWYTLLYFGALWFFGYFYYVSMGIMNDVYLTTWIFPGMAWLILWAIGLTVSYKQIYKAS
jgi:hypothetical protein